MNPLDANGKPMRILLSLNFGLPRTGKSPLAQHANLAGRLEIEMAAIKADAKLAARGVLPSLVAYIEGIGRSVK